MDKITKKESDMSKVDKSELKHMDLEIRLIENDVFDISTYEKIPVSKIGELGAVAMPIIEGLQAVSGAGGSGLYMVNTAGGTLFECASKGAYIGGMTTATGEIGQAALTPVVFNPLTLCSSITMITTMIKLDEISNNVKEIINVFKRKDSAKIKTVIRRLHEIKNEYKNNINNKDLLQVDIIEIRKKLSDMMEIQEEYKEKLDGLLNDKSFKMSNSKQFNEIREAYSYYEWSTYLIGLCKLMLIGYENKFDESRLKDAKNDIETYCDEVKTTYNKCYSYIEERYGKSIVDGIKRTPELLMNGMANFHYFGGIIGGLASIAGNFVGAIGGEKLKTIRENNKIEEVKKIENVNRPQIEMIIEKIDMIDKFYNKPFKMLVGEDSIYIER